MKKYLDLVYTKSVNSVFRALRLATQTRASLISKKNRNYLALAIHELEQLLFTSISVGEERYIFTSPLRGSANSHLYSPPLQ